MPVNPRVRFGLAGALLLALAPAVMTLPVAAVPCTGFSGRVEATDGTFEGDVSWGSQPGSFQPPDYGALAVQLPVEGTVDSILVHLRPRADAALNTSITLDFFVWQDANGIPGALMASAMNVEFALPTVWPADWVVGAALAVPNSKNAWCGIRVHPPSAGFDAVGVASDLDGLPDVPPKTRIAEGLGFPADWQDAALVFGPLAALAIDAHMCTIESVGESFAGAGGGDAGPVVNDGVWDYEQFVPGEYSAPPCAYSWPDTFGSITTLQGWAVSPGSSPVRGLAPVTLLTQDRNVLAQADVEGQALQFYDPVSGGFPPGHLGLFESPIISTEVLGTTAGRLTYRFNTLTSPTSSPSAINLRWIVGSRARLANLTWGPWRDLKCPVAIGGQTFQVPLMARGQQIQVRVGVQNPTGVLIVAKTGNDKGRVVKVVKAPPGYKPVPQFKQVTSSDAKKERVCMTMAAASCLAYWAQNGYPEIYATGNTIAEKNKALQDSLAKHMQPPIGGIGMPGIGRYLKNRGVLGKLPVGPPPRRALKQISLPAAKAKWDSLKTNLSQGHDVILGLNAYKVTAGETTLAGDGHPHAVTAAEIVEVTENGKTTATLRAANGHLKTQDEVKPDAKEEEKPWDTFPVDVDSTNGSIRLHNKKLEGAWKCDFFCVVELNIIRPDPPNPVPNPQFLEPSSMGGGLARAADDTLAQYDYVLKTINHEPVNFFVLMVEVPFYNVQSPPGWSWQPLPVSPPGTFGCDRMLGPHGIAWRTTTNPILPGQTLGGFGFGSPERYVSTELQTQSFVSSSQGYGEYGFVRGPAPTSEPSGVPNESAGPPGITAVASFPNPALNSVSLGFYSSVDEEGRVDLFDSSGRVIRRFSRVRVGRGPNRLTWDRHDDQGRSMPAGVYFYRVRVGSFLARGRLVLVN